MDTLWRFVLVAYMRYKAAKSLLNKYCIDYYWLGSFSWKGKLKIDPISRFGERLQSVQWCSFLWHKIYFEIFSPHSEWMFVIPSRSSMSLHDFFLLTLFKRPFVKQQVVPILFLSLKMSSTLSTLLWIISLLHTLKYLLLCLKSKVIQEYQNFSKDLIMQCFSYFTYYAFVNVKSNKLCDFWVGEWNAIFNVPSLLIE